MNTEGLESVLFRALARTRAEELVWKPSAARNVARHIADLGGYRLRIESEEAVGEHPFKFSIMQPGSRRGEIDSLRSIEAEADRALSGEEMRINQALRELWELARQRLTSPDIREVNRLLDSLE